MALHHTPVRVLPLVRLALLAVVVLVSTLVDVRVFGTQPPRWAVPAVAVALAVLSVLGRRNSRVPEGVTWAVNDGHRVGLLSTGYPVPGDPRIGSLTWFGPEMTAVLSEQRARPVSETAVRLLRCAGRDAEEEQFLALAQAQPAELVLADRDSAGQVLTPRIGLSGGITRFSRAREQVLSWFSDSSPQWQGGRITLEDVRTIATTGIAPGHRLEELLGDFAAPVATDERLGLGYPRCWPSRVDGHPELAEAVLVSSLRADLALQVALDEKLAAENREEQLRVEHWARRWQDRLDSIAYERGLPRVPPAEVRTTRCELSETAGVAVRLVASETDVSTIPLRPKLITLGVPEQPSTLPVLRGSSARRWRLLDNAVLALTGALLVVAGLAILP
ncbi:hypothetical protein [Allokutzneria sp. NRRL B-24872]|uniref:hypothetical protein n=1 Tax=Allokutzneria sp. NRRL B-24872 TaxID=1137961 RepID=UPI000A38E674|nr:hypothetical protein [Allokutzneria sp. NRRL B-24872]